jgi:hypothetical protein
MGTVCQARTNAVTLVVLLALNGPAAQVVVEAVIATIDHSDIRGFGYPHAHDPSGAASH